MIALADRTVADVNIQVSGGARSARDVASDTRRDLVEVSVTDTLDMASTFTLKLHAWDVDLNQVTWPDAPDYAIGKQVTIQMGYVGAPLTTVLVGEITGVHVSFGAEVNPVVTLTGYDFRQRLAVAPRTVVYENKSNDDIAQEVIRRSSLTPNLGAGGAPPPKKIKETQFQETDLEFLIRLAKEDENELLIDGDSVSFAPPPASGDPIALTIANDQLLEFSAGVSAEAPVTSVQVTGLDGSQQPFSATATATAIPGKLGFDTLRTQSVTSTGKPAADADEAQALAQAELDNYLSRYLTGSGSCHGDARLKAGGLVQLDGLGARLSGRYRLTSVTHSYSSTGTFLTSFQVNGAPKPDTQAETSLGQREQGSPAERRNPIFGAVVGVVDVLGDQDNLGQVKVTFPWAKDDKGQDTVSDWAPVVTPMVGDKWGQLFLPQVGDQVLVMFERGELDKPYVIGSIWTKKNQPPAVNGKDIRTIQSRTGHVVILDDSDGTPSITIRDGSGKESIVFDSKSNTLSIKSQNELHIESAQGPVTIKSGGDLKIDCQTITVTGQSGATVQGGQAKLELSGPKASVNGGAMEVV